MQIAAQAAENKRANVNAGGTTANIATRDKERDEKMAKPVDNQSKEKDKVKVMDKNNPLDRQIDMLKRFQETHAD